MSFFIHVHHFQHIYFSLKISQHDLNTFMHSADAFVQSNSQDLYIALELNP